LTALNFFNVQHSSNFHLLPGRLEENSEATVKERASGRLTVRQSAHHGHCSLPATKLELWLPGMRRKTAMVSHGRPDGRNEDGVQRTGMSDEAHSK